MAESDPKLRELELEIKALDDYERLNFLKRQLSHAVVNIGPEETRNLASEIGNWAETASKNGPLESVGEWVKSKTDAFVRSRASHWVGKIGILLLLVAILVMILKFVSGQ